MEHPRLLSNRQEQQHTFVRSPKLKNSMPWQRPLPQEDNRSRTPRPCQIRTSNPSENPQHTSNKNQVQIQQTCSRRLQKQAGHTKHRSGLSLVGNKVGSDIFGPDAKLQSRPLHIQLEKLSNSQQKSENITAINDT